MQESYITEIKIRQVRHLKDITIQVNEKERTHLILTGKNGSGKTSVLEALRDYLQALVLNSGETMVNRSQLNIQFQERSNLAKDYKAGKFILIYFDIFSRNAKNIKSAQKGSDVVSSKKFYRIEDDKRVEFEQFLVNQKFDQFLAKEEGEIGQYEKIGKWFETLERKLTTIFDVSEVKLIYDRKKRKYQIKINGSNESTLQTLPSGYASVINILAELFIRMDNNGNPAYDQQGIVLIDEIDAHLHIELQKNILPFLTSLFPKIQFIVSTHSPFILNSLQNAVVYDLEKKLRIEDLSRYSIDGIVETYFDNDKYSNEVKQEMEEYERLVFSTNLDIQQKDRMYDLKRKFKKIPAHLAPELVSRFQQIESKRLSANHG